MVRVQEDILVEQPLTMGERERERTALLAADTVLLSPMKLRREGVLINRGGVCCTNTTM